MSTPTPETDAMVEQHLRQLNYPNHPVPAEFARRLERGLSITKQSYNEARIERDEAVKEVAHLEKMLSEKSGMLDRQVIANQLAAEMLNGQATRHKEECDKLTQERDRLARWKNEALTVEGRWKKIDTFVRSHPSVTVGSVVADEALRMLREWDQLLHSVGVVEAWMPKPPANLREDIIRAINCRNAESGSDTPDWILGDFLMNCLTSFNEATMARTRYYRQPDEATGILLKMVNQNPNE